VILTRAAATAAAVVLVGMAATGCGGKNHKAASTTTVTRFPPTVPVNNVQLSEGTGACGLLSQADVASATGIAANPGSGTRTKTNESCRWSLRAGTNQFVAVFLTPAGGRQQFDQASKTFGSTAEPVPGIGDQAFVSNDTAYALKGERLVIVEVSTTQSVAARKQAAIKLVGGAIGHG